MARYEVTGVRYQMGDELTLEEKTRKAAEFIRKLEDGTPMILMAEPDNPKDMEAIAVYMDYTRKVGYLKHECCREIKPLLDDDGQYDAVVCGNDGHVTFFVEIEGVAERQEHVGKAERKLPASPLPQDVLLPFSKEERALQVVAPQLLKKAFTTENADEMMKMVELYMPLSEVSLSREDDLWRDRVLKLLRRVCHLKLSDGQKLRFEQWRDKLNDTVGDFHSRHNHWQQKVFERQLSELRTKAAEKGEFFEQFEQYVKGAKEGLTDIVARLQAWFDEMPQMKLRNYNDHLLLAETLNYQGVSRRELYDVYAVLLLLEKYGDAEADQPHDELVDKLKPIFYGSEDEARAFRKKVVGMKPTQITELVNQLVADKKISHLSRHRPLWKVLNEAKIYTRSESNWNMQVK